MKGGLGVSPMTAQILVEGLLRAARELEPGNRWVQLDLGEGCTAIIIVCVPVAAAPPKAER